MLGSKNNIINLKNSGVLLASIVSLIALTLFLFFFIVPRFKVTQEISAKNYETKNKLAKLRQKEGLLLGLQNIVPERVAVLESALPNEKKLAVIIGALKGLCAEAGITLLSFQFSPGVVSSESASLKNNLSVEILINVKVSGSKESLVSFLDNINQTMPLFSVFKIDVVYRSGVVDSDLVISTPVYKSTQSGNASDAEVEQMTPDEEATYQKLLGYRNYSLQTAGNSLPVETGKINPFEER